MDDYLEHFTLFYDQKFKFLSGQPQYLKCNGCETLKNFKEGKTLILSCGDTNENSKCGVQFKVTIPTYIYKDYELDILKKKLEKGLDSKGFNYNVLHKYDLIQNFKENNDYFEEIKKGIEIINDEYKKINLNNRSEKIKEFYDNRINLNKDLKIIKNNITTQNYADENELKELRQKYSLLSKQIKDEYFDVLQYTKNIDNYIRLDKPIIEIVNKDYQEHLSYKNKQTKLKKSSSKCNDLMCKNGIYDEKDFKNWARKNHPDKKHSDNSEEKKRIHKLFAETNDCAQKEEFCKETKKKTTSAKEPVVEKSSTKKTVTINDFKEGMKVEWKHQGKVIRGVVSKINKKKKKKIEILQEDGDIKEIDILKLKIL